MTALMEQEKQRISQRLARLDAEREKLSGALDELEIAERVLARFGGKAVTTEKRRRARPAKMTPGAAAAEGRGRSDQKAPGVSISDACLGWEATERMLRWGHATLSKAREPEEKCVK